MRWLQCAALLVAVAPRVLTGQESCPTPQVIPRDELLDVMTRPRHYDIVPVPNWARYQTDVFLDLMHARLARDSMGAVVLIIGDDWYAGLKAATGLTDSMVHTGMRLAWEVGQAILLDFRRDVVVRRMSPELRPRLKLAANALLFWPDTGDLPGKFSYRDTITEPHLQVTSRRVISYRLLELDSGLVVYDQVVGAYGRPTSGFWGTILAAIGEAAVVESRLAPADGNLYTYTIGKKIVSLSVTATVFRDGRAIRGIAPELAPLERRLRQKIDVEYWPYRCSAKGR